MTTEHSEQSTMLQGSDPGALRKINNRNKQFWAKQSKLTEQRISDPILYALAMLHMRSESIRMSCRERKSLDQALADAEEALQIFRKNPTAAESSRRRSLSRKGGSALKTDALQVLIQSCVRKMPDLTQQGLRHQLKKHVGLGTIVAVDDQKIEFLDHNRKLKTAPISGLKDRLSSARSKIDSF